MASASASTIPQPASRIATASPVTLPPTNPSPAPSSGKPRKSLPAPGEISRHQSASPLPSKLRVPSSSASKSSNPGSPEKTVRRSVSIASFPQPPKPGSSSSSAGRPSLPAASSLSKVTNASASNHNKSASASTTASAGGGARGSKKKTARLDSTASSHISKSSRTPSLLNGSGDGKSIISSNSPAPSRSSSAQDMYDDVSSGVGRRGREAGADDALAGSKRASRGKEGKGNVIVSMRVRPDLAGAESGRSDGEWLVDGRRSLVSFRGKEGGDYFYDNVFTTHDTNAKVYDASAKRLVRRVMEGYHGTVFAYGMTGTGKTFSMQGTATSPGVIPLAITDIFSYIRETPHREFLLRVSYLEIYNEKIHDLLSPPVSTGTGPSAQQPQQEEIKLREDSKRGVYATPLKEEIVQSPTQLLRVIARGDHARRTSSTQFNARSSRSHAVVQIVVESRDRAQANAPTPSKRSALVPGGVRVSTLSLIDLAGSERAADNKERRTEGAHINKSLLTLGTVIARLSGDAKDAKGGSGSEKQGSHLPYRDSKLTRLLQPALQGNSLVSILCTIQIGASGSVATAHSHTGETLNTLKFAARAKNNIISHAKRAEESFGGGNGDAGSRVLLERYRMEIQSLRTQLENQAKSTATAPSEPAETEVKVDEQTQRESEERHEEQMLEMQLARTALKERIEHLNRLILSSKSTGVNAGGFGLRTSASQSTLGRSSGLYRTTSMTSITSNSTIPGGQQPASYLPNDDDEEDTIGEFADGMASLQAQVNALHADLADKNRYISTLERRLLQARRSSHSRVSMGLNHHHHHLKTSSNGSATASSANASTTASASSDSDVAAVLREKDTEIADLRLQLDDKDRMVAALRSAARQRDLAQLTGTALAGSGIGHHNRAEAAPTPPPMHPPPPVGGAADFNRAMSMGSASNAAKSSINGGTAKHQSSGSNSSSSVSAGHGHNHGGTISPVALRSPVQLPENEKEKERARKRRSVDEMSRLLDEMIQSRVETGHLIKTSKGGVRVASNSVSNPHASTTVASPSTTGGSNAHGVGARRPNSSDSSRSASTSASTAMDTSGISSNNNNSNNDEETADVPKKASSSSVTIIHSITHNIPGVEPVPVEPA